MPREAKESPKEFRVDSVQPGESWKQYINRLRGLPGQGSAQMAGIIAATALMGKRPDAPANEARVQTLARRVARHSSFRSLSRDPEALRLARGGKGSELILRMGEIKRRQRRASRSPALS